jgi:hypothetical protein
VPGGKAKLDPGLDGPILRISVDCPDKWAVLKRQKARAVGLEPFAMNIPGSDLLSHKASLAVPSAVEGLTSVFGMGTGVTPLL